MTVATIKFLDRKKILQADVVVNLRINGPVKRFSAKLDLAKYAFPATSTIYIHAKQLMETLRFDLGSVGQPRPETLFDISKLRGERVTFNIYVVDPATAQKLGTVETVRPLMEGKPQGNAISLLPVDVSSRLDGPVWRIDYCETDQESRADAPVLLFDREAAEESASIFLQNTSVRALVFPAAMREILTKILLIDKHTYVPESRSWRDSWLRLAIRLTGEDVPINNDGEALLDWIGSAVSVLSRRADFLCSFIKARRQ